MNTTTNLHGLAGVEQRIKERLAVLAQTPHAASAHVPPTVTAPVPPPPDANVREPKKAHGLDLVIRSFEAKLARQAARSRWIQHGVPVPVSEPERHLGRRCRGVFRIPLVY